MTEEKSFEFKYIGQIITLFALEVLILLVRIAIPINSAIEGVGIQYEWLVSETIYFVIQGFLVIVLANHLIFKNSYKDMGIHGLKGNTLSLIGNLVYLLIVAGVTLAINYIGGERHLYTGMQMILKLIMIFIGTAFIQEVIYRGCIQRAFIKLTNNWIASVICSSILFAVTYFVLGLINSGFDSKYMDQILMSTGIAFGIGTYLGLLYHVTNNLWICIIVHGTYEAINIVGDSFLIYPFKIVYIVCVLVYLIYEVVKYNKNHNSQLCDSEELAEESNEYVNEELTEEPNEYVNEGLTEEPNEYSNEELTKEPNEYSNEGLTEEPNEYSNEELTKEPNEYSNEKSTDESNEVYQKYDENNGSDDEFNIDLSYEMSNESKDVIREIIEDNEINNSVRESQVCKEKIDELGQTRDVSLVDLNRELSKTQSNISLDDKICLVPEPSENKLDLAELVDSIEPKEDNLEKVTIDTIDENYMSHLERSLGDCIAIYPPVKSSELPISILAFGGSKFNALVTSGMREEAMNVPEYLKADAYAELVMFISKEYDLSKEGMLLPENNWLLEGLRELATYPKMTQGYLGWGHTVGNGENREAYYDGSELCGMLIYPPVMQDDMTFYTFKNESKTTYIYDVMPLYKEEMDFILKHSGDLYFTKSKEFGVSQIIEKNRKNVCESDALPVN